MNKYLFLDIDGVLNSNNYLTGTSDLPYPLNSFDPIAIQRVNKIVEATGCKVVVSSSWRFDKGLQNLFKKVGLNFPIHGVTNSLLNRGQEIEDYLLALTEPYRYAVLDDCDDFLSIACGKHFVQTNPTIGIQECDVERVINILNNTK